MKPPEINEFLEHDVIGQEEALRFVAVAIFKHLQGEPFGNLMMIGNSGTGKTTIMRSMERLYSEHDEFSKYRVVVIMNANTFANDEGVIDTSRLFLRLEERFDFNTKTWELSASLRLRYRLRATFRWDAVQKGRYWRAPAGTEVFVTLAGDQGQFREQVRVQVAIERSFRLLLRLRFEVAWQKEGAAFFIGQGDVSDLWFRLRIYQNWGQ